jgi:hypothetical protein
MILEIERESTGSHSGELALEAAVGLSQERKWNELQLYQIIQPTRNTQHLLFNPSYIFPLSLQSSGISCWLYILLVVYLVGCISCWLYILLVVLFD